MHRCKKRSRRTLRSFCSLLSASAGVDDAVFADDADDFEDRLFPLLLLGV